MKLENVYTADELEKDLREKLTLDKAKLFLKCQIEFYAGMNQQSDFVKYYINLHKDVLRKFEEGYKRCQ